jgi:hypothetical protein
LLEYQLPDEERMLQMRQNAVEFLKPLDMANGRMKSIAQGTVRAINHPEAFPLPLRDSACT